MTHHPLVVSRLRPVTAALFALAGLFSIPLAARAQAAAPDFRTGFCVKPDTTRNGGLSPALSAVVSEPERGPVPLPSKIPPYPAEVRRDGYRGAVSIAFVVDTLGRPVVETAQVLDSTDPILSRWACGAVAKLRYAPAEHQGRRVFAQAVQPFAYSAQVKR